MYIELRVISMTHTERDTTTAVSQKRSDKMAEKEEEDETQSWQNFTQETSMHGIRYIHLPASSTIRR